MRTPCWNLRRFYSMTLAFHCLLVRFSRVAPPLYLYAYSLYIGSTVPSRIAKDAIDSSIPKQVMIDYFETCSREYFPPYHWSLVSPSYACILMRRYDPHGEESEGYSGYSYQHWETFAYCFYGIPTCRTRKQLQSKNLILTFCHLKYSYFPSDWTKFWCTLPCQCPSNFPQR